MGLLSTIVCFGARERLGTSGMLPRDVQVRDVMTVAPETVSLDAPLTAAARLMAEKDIGDVIVIEPGTERVAGIVTDRDIAIRAVAQRRDPDTTTVEEIFSRDLVAAAPRRSRPTRHRSDGGPEGAAAARGRGRPCGRDRVARRSRGRDERRIGARRDQRRRPGSLSRTSCSLSCSS